MEENNVEVEENYPVRLNIDFPERLSRWTTFVRIFMVIPIYIVFALLGAVGFDLNNQAVYFGAGGGFIILATIVMLLFRQKYPRWWFDWNLEMSRFGLRISSYFFLLRDEYPSTDEHQAVHLDIDYPDASKLNRWLPLVKWLLAIPHYVLLSFLGLFSLIAMIFAWLAIIITARYPRFLFNFIVGVFRWMTRVQAYAFLMVTDKYPPFSLK